VGGVSVPDQLCTASLARGRRRGLNVAATLFRHEFGRGGRGRRWDMIVPPRPVACWTLLAERSVQRSSRRLDMREQVRDLARAAYGETSLTENTTPTGAAEKQNVV
jgi:hypothetical protein